MWSMLFVIVWWLWFLVLLQRSVIAEHSADGAFGQEPELLALLQWIGASASLASELHYDITGNTQISQVGTTRFQHVAIHCYGLA